MWGEGIPYAEGRPARDVPREPAADPLDQVN